MKYMNLWRRGDVVYWRIGPKPRGWVHWFGKNGITIAPRDWWGVLFYLARWWLLWFALSSPDPVLTAALWHS